MKIAIILLFIFQNTFSKDIIVPPPVDSKDGRKDFFYDLLRATIKKMDGDYNLKLHPEQMNQVRQLKSLEVGKIDLSWTMRSPDRDKQATPVNFPILKKLLGYRVCLIKSGRASTLEESVRMKGIHSISYIQGRGWPDVEILERAGLNVLIGNYTNLFEMVRRERGDCFLRSILEIDQEIQNEEHSIGLEVESSFAIQYDAEMVFYINKNRVEFHRDFSRALKKVVASDEYNRLFNTYYSGVLLKYNHSSRKVYHLK